MKNKIYILASIAALTLLSVSCESFLDNPPRHQWEVSQALTTPEKAEQAVNGIYPRFVVGDNINGNLCVAQADRSGFLKYSETEYNMVYTQSGTTSAPSAVWSTCYSAINACNLAINGIPAIPDASFANAARKTQLIAEARFLRGYMHSLIMLHYCHWWESDMGSIYGIVYRDQTSDVANVNAPRITVGESWEKIMDDIRFGMDNMSDNFATNRRVSKIFATAYMAKLKLIRGSAAGIQTDLTEAKALIDGLLTGLPSAIAMESDMRNLYANSWDSKENIFVRYLEDNGNRTTNAGYWTEYGLGQMSQVLTNVLDAAGNNVPQSAAVCGLQYGLDWFRADPRWYIATGKARKAETWDDTYAWVWKKIYREGRVAGRTLGDEKYATYYMRLPELYILQAELIARTNGTMAQAIAPINQMRAKRSYPVLDQIPTPANIEEFWDILMQEYAKELFLENGSEYWASLRIPKNGKTYMEVIKETSSSFSYDRTKRQYPIPNAEIVNNPNAYQNPGQE